MQAKQEKVLRIAAPAKINLHLRVGPPRPDGFHPLSTWMTTIGLFDQLTFNEAGGDQISVTCSEPTLPVDDRNIVIKAAKLLQQHSPQLIKSNVKIYLEKTIPHGGGLGGGSSDAAFTLMGLNRFWKLGKSLEDLHTFAARLGSDVPFFLHGPSSICQGRGEAVREIPAPKKASWVLLILPDLSMPTPAVYRNFDEMKLGNISDVDEEPDWDRWASLSSDDLLPLLVNDLEPPAFAIEPRLSDLRIRIEKTLNRPVRMSGSGSSLFTLFDDFQAAENAGANIQTADMRALPLRLAPLTIKT